MILPQLFSHKLNKFTLGCAQGRKERKACQISVFSQVKYCFLFSWNWEQMKQYVYKDQVTCYTAQIWVYGTRSTTCFHYQNPQDKYNQIFFCECSRYFAWVIGNTIINKLLNWFILPQMLAKKETWKCWANIHVSQYWYI